MTSRFNLTKLMREFYLYRRPSLIQRLRLRGWTDAHFFKLITVDPASIVHYQDIRLLDHPRLSTYEPGTGSGARHFLLSNIGKVLSGDWDLVRSDFVENDVFRLLEDRFVRGIDWEESEVFRRWAKEVGPGQRRWRSRSYQGMLDKAKEVERLYEQIGSNGYRVSSRQTPPVDEVTVSIDRNGELLYNNLGGHHRLSIAKLLKVPAIPVLVLLRHEQWQVVRDEVRRGGQSGVGDGAEEMLGHPDLAGLLPARARSPVAPLQPEQERE